MEIVDIIIAGVVVCFAGMAQSAVGFGYGLISTPLLLWLGFPLPSVMVLVWTCSMFQSVICARKLQTDVPWRLSLTAAGVIIFSVLAGIFLLKRLLVLNTEHILMVVGAILCLLVAIQALWRPRPVRSMHWAWAGLAFVFSGLLAGLCGMGGPPLVLWSMAHDWSSQKTRGFLFSVFAVVIPFHMAIMTLTFGVSILWNVALGVAFLPLVYLGTAIGLPVGNRMEKEKLRRIAYAVLFLIGTSALAPALWAQLN